MSVWNLLSFGSIRRMLIFWYKNISSTCRSAIRLVTESVWMSVRYLNALSFRLFRRSILLWLVDDLVDTSTLKLAFSWLLNKEAYLKGEKQHYKTHKSTAYIIFIAHKCLVTSGHVRSGLSDWVQSFAEYVLRFKQISSDVIRDAESIVS